MNRSIYPHETAPLHDGDFTSTRTPETHGAAPHHSTAPSARKGCIVTSYIRFTYQDESNYLYLTASRTAGNTYLVCDEDGPLAFVNTAHRALSLTREGHEVFGPSGAALAHVVCEVTA